MSSRCVHLDCKMVLAVSHIQYKTCCDSFAAGILYALLVFEIQKASIHHWLTHVPAGLHLPSPCSQG